MGNPPAAHRLVSILWLGNVFYPDVFDYDLEEEVKEFYKVFYNYELSNSEISEMMKYSTGNAEQTASSPVPILGVLAGLSAAVILRRR
jgi:iron complex transport system substrate-binding protein